MYESVFLVCDNTNQKFLLVSNFVKIKRSAIKQFYVANNGYILCFSPYHEIKSWKCKNGEAFQVLFRKTYQDYHNIQILSGLLISSKLVATGFTCVILVYILLL